MLAEMTAEQLMEWREFAREEPFGFHPTAELVSLLCSVIAGAAPFRTGAAPPPSAFRWRPGSPPDETPADLQTIFGGAETDGLDLSRPLPD